MTDQAELPLDWDEAVAEAAIDLGRLARDRMGEAGDLITPADLRRLGLGMQPAGAELLRRAEAPDAQRLREDYDRFAEQAYWYYLMVRQGGPDGSDLDDAVEEDFLDMLRAWASTRTEPGYAAALVSPPDAATAEPASAVAVDSVKCRVCGRTPGLVHDETAGTVERCGYGYREGDFSWVCNKLPSQHGEYEPGHPFEATR